MLTTIASLTALTRPLVLSLPDSRTAFINVAFFYFIFVWVISITACKDMNMYMKVEGRRQEVRGGGSVIVAVESDSNQYLT